MSVPGPIPVPWQERFWRYVTPGAPDECWEWQGSRDAHGYGRLNRGGKHGAHTKAHRAAYKLAHGPFDPELDVCHHCDNPPCCNPAHLFLGDAAANARDMASKGRAPAQRGHRNGRERLTDDQVRELRALAAAGGHYATLAAQFGISETNASDIARGNRRRRAGGPIALRRDHADRWAARKARAMSARTILGRGRVERPRSDVGTSRPRPEHQRGGT